MYTFLLRPQVRRSRNIVGGGAATSAATEQQHRWRPQVWRSSNINCCHLVMIFVRIRKTPSRSPSPMDAAAAQLVAEPVKPDGELVS
ncbi:hypothetical protein Hanom_Chr16g01426121 [Helianthus anomalus]